MIILKATTETLQITTTTAAGLDYSISYSDITSTTFAPSSSEGKISSATTTSALAAPAASTQRQVKLIVIANRDANLTDTVSVQKVISGTAYNLTPAITLLQGELIQYVDGNGWTYYSATGAIKGSGAAAGSTTEIQFNNGGILASEADLTWNSTKNSLSMLNSSQINMASLSSEPTLTSGPAPTIASVGAPASGTTGNALSIPVPSGVTVGSLVVIVGGGEYTTATLPDSTSISIPGFTVAQIVAYTPYASFSEFAFIMYKYATAADTGTYALTYNTVAGHGTDDMGAIATVIAGGPTSGNPFVDTFRSGTAAVSPSVTVSTFTPAANNSLLIASAWNDDTVTSSSPSGWTANASSAGNPTIGLATLRQTTAAATGSLTWTSATNTDFAILIGTIRAPLVPTNSLLLYARTTSGDIAPSFIDTGLSPVSLQTAAWQSNVATWTPGVAAGAWTGQSAHAQGTPTIPTLTTTSAYTAMRRSLYPTVATTANQQVGIWSDFSFLRGATAGQGGFLYVCRFGLETWTAGDRLFIGLSAGSTTLTQANPTTIADTMGFAVNSGDTAISFIHNDATPTSTKDTISGQPTLASGNAYDAYIYCKPNDTTVYYRLDNALTRTTIIDGSATITLPTNTTFLAAHAEIGNGPTNTAAGAATIGINRIYVETIR